MSENSKTSEAMADSTFSEDYIHENRGAVMEGISIAFAILTTIFVPLRFWARTMRRWDLGFDDVLILAAYIVNLGLCAIGVLLVRIGGVGQHADVLKAYNPAALVGWAKVLIAFEFAYFTAVALPKLSILCLYLRVFNWKRGPWRWVTFFLFGLVTANWLSMMIAVCFQCQPLPFWWDRTIRGGKCFDVQRFFHAQSIPGFVLDFLIMILPLRTIWLLKLSVLKKLALVLVFVVASFGVIASIIRATIFFSNSAFDDRTWASTLLCGWSVVEAGCYILANCLSHLRPLFSRFVPQELKDALASTTQWTAATPSLSLAPSRSRKGLSRKAEEDDNELISSPRSPSMQCWPPSTPESFSLADAPQHGEWLLPRTGTNVYIYGQRTDPRDPVVIGSGGPGLGTNKQDGQICVTTEVSTEVSCEDSSGRVIKDAGSLA